jgi:hypothetical protein
LLSSMPKKRGMLGPVRSISRTPTVWPCSESVRASCVVMLLLPTPPLPDRTSTILRTLSSGMVASQSGARDVGFDWSMAVLRRRRMVWVKMVVERFEIIIGRSGGGRDRRSDSPWQRLF